MKRLSKEERLGAATLAAVVVLVTVGALLLRTCDSNVPGADVPVTILYQEADTLPEKSEQSVKSDRSDKSERSDRSVKSNRSDRSDRAAKSDRPAKSDRSAQTVAPRDFLSDSIPTRR